MTALPVIEILPGHGKRAARGAPWIYSNEIRMTAEAKALPPGALVQVQAGPRSLGLGFFHPHTLIAVRLLPDAGEDLEQWLTQRIRAALALRERLFDAPYYRLIHAEADGCPGLVVDRFGPHLVVQIGSAGFERLKPQLAAALTTALAPESILLKNDTAARTLEGLPSYVEPLAGQPLAEIVLIENGASFVIRPAHGQKTGWFFDHRDNRAAFARLARGRSVLDAYAYAGAFGVLALKAGATRALMVDSSDGALALARESAALNGVEDRAEFRREDVFAALESLGAAGARFGAVGVDPPAFVKSKKDLAAGAKGYRKLARLAGPLVEPGGAFFIASCSHNMPADLFAEEVQEGLLRAGRTGRILRSAGAGPDHPVHPALPETAYLKALLFQLD